MSVCVYMSECVCVSVSVREKVSVCVVCVSECACVCVCEREREVLTTFDVKDGFNLPPRKTTPRSVLRKREGLVERH